MMRVEMTFNDEAIAATGYTKRDVYYTVKKAFTEHGLRCISDGETLAFADNGHQDDYAHMWNEMFRLVRSGWFLRCATSLIFIEDDEVEDVLSQAWKLERHGA